MDMELSKLFEWLKEMYPGEVKGNFIRALSEKTGIPEQTLYRWNDGALQEMKRSVSSKNYKKLIAFIAECLHIEVPDAREKLNEFGFECFKDVKYITTEDVSHGNDAEEVVEQEKVVAEDISHANDIEEVVEQEKNTTEDVFSENNVEEIAEQEVITSEIETQGLKPHICKALEQLLDRIGFEIITSKLINGKDCILWEVRCKEEERFNRILFFNEKPDILERILQVNVREDNYIEQRQWVNKCSIDKEGFIFINCENADVCEKAKTDTWTKQNLLFIGISEKTFFVTGSSNEKTKRLRKYIQKNT